MVNLINLLLVLLVLSLLAVGIYGDRMGEELKVVPNSDEISGRACTNEDEVCTPASGELDIMEG